MTMSPARRHLGRHIVVASDFEIMPQQSIGPEDIIVADSYPWFNIHLYHHDVVVADYQVVVYNCMGTDVVDKLISHAFGLVIH